MQRILFPDALTAVIGALAAQLPGLGFSGVPVRSRVAATRDPRFVRVFDTGGARANLVTHAAQLTIEAWAQSDADAKAVALACWAIVIGLEGTVTGGVTIYGVQDFSGPAFLPDPTSDQSRYTWTTSVNVRGAAA